MSSGETFMSWSVKGAQSAEGNGSAPEFSARNCRARAGRRPRSREWGWTLAIAVCLGPGGLEMVRAEEHPLPEPAVSEIGRITMNIAKGSIVDALRLVAEQGGLNLVIGPGVEGEVSVYLANVSLQTALRAIAVNNGFAYAVDDEVISVSKPPDASGQGQAPPMVTRVFTLRSADAERVRDALTHVLSRFGRMEVLNENSESVFATERLSSLAGDVGDQLQQNQFRANGAAPGQAQGVPNLPGNNVDRARHARTLIVTDIEPIVTAVADLVADLDRMPPQVLIEARIVEMTTDLQRELGIDWNIDILANGPILNHELPLDWRAGFAPGDQIRYTRQGLPRTATGISLGTIDFSRFTSLVRAHQSDSSVRLLSNPRMLVFNNHSASILVGERYPIFEANITDFGTLTEAFDTYIPVGVQLEVMPTIMIDGRVSLAVHAMTSALGDDVVGTTGLTVARILTRELNTRAVMADGETIVLGGLISDRKARTVNKVPGLGDIPGLDALFRQESPATQRVDLLVFLTAHVEACTEMDSRDRKVYEMYKPHFKKIDRIQDVPVRFDIPSEPHPGPPAFAEPTAHLEPCIEDEYGPGSIERDEAPFDDSESSPREPRLRDQSTRPGAPMRSLRSARHDASAGHRRANDDRDVREAITRMMRKRVQATGTAGVQGASLWRDHSSDTPVASRGGDDERR